MNKLSIVVGVILLMMLITGMWFMGNYNALVTTSLAVDKDWSAVETQYQKRFDLVDNLVQSVKGSQKQEVEVFGEIARARSMYNGAKSSDDKVAAINNMGTNLSIVPRLQEAYPDLKSTALMAGLMLELKLTESAILKARDKYNETTINYNRGIRQFPTIIFARIFGFEKRTLFEASTGAENKVDVKF